jgi:hypothetical protein
MQTEEHMILSKETFEFTSKVVSRPALLCCARSLSTTTHLGGLQHAARNLSAFKRRAS